jgi:hypothetical protein
MFNRGRRDQFLSPGGRSRLAIGLICLIAAPIQTLTEDFATVLMVSMAGLDMSLWLLSKGLLAALAA